MALKLKKKPTTSATVISAVQPTKLPSPADLANAQPITVHPLVKSPVAAQILDVSTAYLARDRWFAKKEGIPPVVPYIRMSNGAVRYAVPDLLAVIEHSRVST